MKRDYTIAVTPFYKTGLFFLLISAFLLFAQFAYSQNNLSLGNKVWYDFNDNGINESNEPGISGMTVAIYLDNNTDGLADPEFTPMWTVTDVNGNYSFTNLAAGKYFVKLYSWYSHYKSTVYGGDPDNNVDDDNNGFSQDLSNYEITGKTITLTPAASGNNTYDFGVWKTNGLGDFVWFDDNADGIQDAGEAGIPNVTVNLLNANGDLLATTTTGANGKYFFHDVAQYGTSFQLQFITPAGYSPTLANGGTDDAKDSDPVNGKIVNVSVPYGQWDHNFDAGFRLGSGAALPVKMNSFTAYLKNNKVDLNWMTDYEQNSDFFVVEKSTTGKEFKDIAIVMASNNTSALSKYSYIDSDIPAAGLLYYRLRIKDKDGKTDYSDIKIVRLQATINLTISVFPNPVVNQVKITVPEQWYAKRVVFQIIGSDGIIRKVFVKESCSQTELFDFSSLPKGSYIVRLACNNQTAQQVVVK